MNHLRKAIEYLEERYTCSSCHAMTIVLHHKYDYPIFVLKDEERSFKLADGTLAPIHSFVKVPDDVALDVKGERSFKSIAEEFSAENPIFESVTEEYLIKIAGVSEEDIEEAEEDLEAIEW